MNELEHEPFVCPWKFSTWISGWAIHFIKENVDTSCQRLFSLVPENGRHCVLGTHTRKANSNLIVPWKQKAITWGQAGRPQASAHSASLFTKSVLLGTWSKRQNFAGACTGNSNSWSDFSWCLQMRGMWQSRVLAYSEEAKRPALRPPTKTSHQRRKLRREQRELGLPTQPASSERPQWHKLMVALCGWPSACQHFSFG